jgi:hypothetical protein
LLGKEMILFKRNSRERVSLEKEIRVMSYV